MHAKRVKKYGEPGPAKPRVRARGAGHVTAEGYLRITAPDGRMRSQHRVVMEGVLGRPLHPFETIHHRNGRRADNRPENLELRASHHGPGQTVEDLVLFVVKHYPKAVRAALAGHPIQLNLLT